LLVREEILEAGVVEGDVFGVQEGADGRVDWLVNMAAHGSLAVGLAVAVANSNSEGGFRKHEEELRGTRA
jgi:hypothetical protein